MPLLDKLIRHPHPLGLVGDNVVPLHAIAAILSRRILDTEVKKITHNVMWLTMHGLVPKEPAIMATQYEIDRDQDDTTQNVMMSVQAPLRRLG